MRSRKGRTATQGKEKAVEKTLPEVEDGEEYGDANASEEELEEGKRFFACYLLASLCPRHKSRTYIGFTVNPRRRIRQHNGEIRCGATRTKRGRPWEMTLCIYGFPSNVSALQFEWAWQHPTESLAVRKAASCFKSLSGIANKIKLAYTMLSLPAWENLNATVNFFSTKYMKYIDGCPKLPKQMKTIFCVMDELPCYIKGPILDDSSEEDYHEDDGKESSISACWEVEGNHAQMTVRHPPDPWRKDDHFRESMESEAPSCSIRSPKAKEKPVDDVKVMNSKESLISYDPKIWRGFSSVRNPIETTESYCSIESPELGQEESRISVDATEDLFGLVKQKDIECLVLDSTPRSCSSNRQVLSSEGDVINLVTPPSFLISSCWNKHKKNPVSMAIIDLTDSPISL
ncbi:structure-specific endonuclease subunit SLX1-like [Zingiber officinale]|uniref:structure-specific endonuclease subunit SLX1-like n=1 Tax=Zingiber officinale TaxID=94328 RepID=UPI001C4C7FF8|nr:structure-specific endonuclease subunit SLX1-like [Zingiber officinale]